MEKDFLKKYEDEIRGIIVEMLNAEKQWKINRVKDIYKDILDEFVKCNTNINIETNYLPVYISSNYFEEENQYAHLLFIFKLEKSEVLSLLVYDDEAVLDMIIADETIHKLSNKKKLKKFFSEDFLYDMDLHSLLNIAEEISKSINVLHMDFHKRYIYELNTLFSIIDKKEMMMLFGYFLYIYFYKQFTLYYKYYSMLNIVFNSKNDDINKLRAVCSLFYSLIFSEKEIPSENVFAIDDITTTDKAAQKIGDAEQFEYTYRTRHANGKCIIVDCSKYSKRKNINNIINIYSNRVEEEYLSSNIIILSERKVINDIVLHINFDNFTDRRYHAIKNEYDIFQKYISEFEDFMEEKYEISWLSCDDIDMKKYTKKMSNKIYDSAVIEKHLADKYAPIILALYDFFEFLRSKYYITQEDYDKFIKDCDAIYGAGDTHIDITKHSSNIDPVIVFSKAIYTLYTNHSELFSDADDSVPFIYEGNRNNKQLICFKNIEESVEFAQNNIDKIDSYESFNEIFMQSESVEDILPKIKDVLIEKGIQIFNKNRKDYRINDKTYFALNVEKLKEFVEQCE